MINAVNNFIHYEIGQVVGICKYLGHEYYVQYKLKRERFGRFLCPCGNEFEASINKVKKRNAKCQQCKEKNFRASRKTHGESGCKEYNTWARIKARCYDINCKKYDDYGGRGIKMCDRWFNSYELFLLDMGRAPSPLHSIDRIDVNGDYEPSNCKWSTPREQANNKRRNVIHTYKDETGTLRYFTDKYNINFERAQRRYECGWNIKRIIEMPELFQKGKLVLNVETGILYESLNDAAKAHNIARTTLKRYLDNPEKHKIQLTFV